MNESPTGGHSLPSLPVRAWQVLFSPERLFLALRERPLWFWVMAISALLVGTTVWFIPEEAWTNLMREQLMQSGSGTEGGLPNAGGTGFRVMRMIGGGISVFLGQGLIACFTFGCFVFFLGDEGDFKQHLSIVAHAGVVPALGAVVALPLRISQLDPQLTLSVGTLFPFLPDGYFYSVLQSLDLFALWAAVLTGLGVSLLDSRRSWGSAASVTVGLALVFALTVGFFR